MPSTPKQMRAAGMELRRRRDGKVRQQDRGRATRPFGAASNETLRAFAGWPNPREQREAANRELALRATGAHERAFPNRAFGKADLATVKFFAYATDDEIRKRNGEI